MRQMKNKHMKEWSTYKQHIFVLDMDILQNTGRRALGQDSNFITIVPIITAAVCIGNPIQLPLFRNVVTPLVLFLVGVPAPRHAVITTPATVVVVVVATTSTALEPEECAGDRRCDDAQEGLGERQRALGVAAVQRHTRDILDQVVERGVLEQRARGGELKERVTGQPAADDLPLFGGSLAAAKSSAEPIASEASNNPSP